MNSKAFLHRLNETKEGQKYLSTIDIICQENRGISKEKGFNVHHIQPKALGGRDTPENLVKLTILEHCQLHVLLAKAIPCEQTFRPILRMSSSQVKNLSDLDRVNLEQICEWSKTYEAVCHLPRPKEVIVKIKQTKAKNRYVCSEETRKKISLAGKEKPKSLKTRERMSLYQKGRPKSEEHRENIRKAHNTEEYRQKASERAKKHVRTEQHRQHLLEAHRTEAYRQKASTIQKGRPKSEEHRENIKKAHNTEAYRQKASAIRKGRKGNTAGRVWIHDTCGHTRLIQKELVQNFLSQGWLLNRK